MYFRKCLYYDTILSYFGFVTFRSRRTYLKVFKRTNFYIVQMYNLFLTYTNFCTYFFKLFLPCLKAFSLLFQRS